MNVTRRHFAGLTIAATTAASVGALPAIAGDGREGSLSGRKGYTVVGTVEVKKVGGKTIVALKDDYVFDPNKNPPDIKIGFGNGEVYAQGSKIHDKLEIKTGAAEFEVPANIDTDQFSELYIYCEKFTVILAVAPLN